MAQPEPAPVTQFDGSPFEALNCMAAVAAMALDAATGIKTTGARIRELQDDKSGGIGLDDVRVAFKRGWGRGFTISRSPATLQKRLAAHLGAAVAGRYSAVPRSIRNQKDFTGAHAVYAVGLVPGGVRIIDPITRPATAETWPASVFWAFYSAGLAQAGWVPGGASGGASGGGQDVSAPATGRPAPAWLNDPSRVLTDADLAEFKAWVLSRQSADANDLRTLTFYLDRLLPAYRGRTVAELRADAPGLFTQTDLFTQPDIFEQAGAAIGQALINAVWVLAALGIVVVGLYMLATASDG